MMPGIGSLGLRAKLILLLTASSFSGLLLASLAFVLVDRYGQRQNALRVLEHEARFLGEYSAAILDFGEPAGLAPIFKALGDNQHLMAVVLYGANGREFAKYVRKDLARLYQAPPPQVEQTVIGRESIVLSDEIVFQGRRVGYLHIERDLRDVDARARQFIGIAALVLMAAFVLGLAVSLRVQRIITEPILALSRTANQVTSDRDYSLRAVKRGVDEIGELVEDFNAMLAEIQKRDVDLQTARDQLEQRVLSRTEELSKANRRLESEVRTRRAAEEALRESRQKLLLHISQTPLGVVDFDLEARATAWNPAAGKIFGWSEPEILGRKLWDFLVPAEETGKIQPLWRELVTNRGWRHGINKNLTKEGRHIICEWFNTPLVDENGNVMGVSSLVQDITQRVEAEERFAKVFQASPAAVSILTLAEGRFIDLNESFIHLLGYSRGDLIGRATNELGLWADPAEQERLFKLARGKGGVRHFECTLRAADGRLRNTLISAEVITLAEQDCLVLQAYDLTERLNLESQLRQAQKMEAVGQLAAGVAHDFNNILTIIQGHSNLLGVVHPDDEDAESIREISAAADRAAHLTHQLLAFSRKQVMQAREVNLNEVVNNSAKMLRRLLGEGIELVCRVSDVPAMVHADIGMLDQIVMNLAVNARDAMQGRGRLTLAISTVAYEEKDLESSSEVRPGSFVQLAVTDTGCGMDALTMARVFEPFFTTKEVGKGTGLGLATVYGIVKQHDGWVEVESAVGKGTTFRILLPRTEKVAESPATPGGNVAPAKGSEVVLVTEDELALRGMVVKALERHGYRTFTAGDGEEALAVWQRHRDEIDLLLTDMMMPKGISGWELAKLMRQDRPELKVIYTSGYSPEVFGKEAVMDDLANFLPKPYRMQKLAALVRQTLDTQASA